MGGFRWAVGIGIWSALVLALFYLKKPLPARMPLALATARDLIVAVAMLIGASTRGRLALRVAGLERVLRTPADRLLIAAGLGYGGLGLLALAAAQVGGLRPVPWLLGALLVVAMALMLLEALAPPTAQDPLRALDKGCPENYHRGVLDDL